MKIIWNQVTWYSKLLAVILFVATFFLGFYFKAEFQKIKDNTIPEIKEEIVVVKKILKYLTENIVSIASKARLMRNRILQKKV